MAEIEVCLDSTDLVQLLRENKESNNLKFNLRHDQEGLLNILVFEVDGGRNLYTHLRNIVSCF